MPFRSTAHFHATSTSNLSKKTVQVPSHVSCPYEAAPWSPFNFLFSLVKEKAVWVRAIPLNNRLTNKSRNRESHEHEACTVYIVLPPTSPERASFPQEWSCCSTYSRFEGNTLTLVECDAVQRRLSEFRSVNKEPTEDDVPGKLLPASFRGSPTKRKKDAKDALAVVDLKRKALCYVNSKPCEE